MLTTQYEALIAPMDLYVSAADKGVPPLVYYGIALCEEAGEAAGKIKKLYRDAPDYDTFRKAYALELGDVLWYLTRGANHVGYTLGDIMAMNIEKLQSRHARGVARGSGDNR